MPPRFDALGAVPRYLGRKSDHAPSFCGDAAVKPASDWFTPATPTRGMSATTSRRCYTGLRLRPTASSPSKPKPTSGAVLGSGTRVMVPE